MTVSFALSFESHSREIVDLSLHRNNVRKQWDEETPVGTSDFWAMLLEIQTQATPY